MILQLSSLLRLAESAPRGTLLVVCLLATLAGCHDTVESHMVSLDVANMLIPVIRRLMGASLWQVRF